jgi:hypothetical protein
MIEEAAKWAVAIIAIVAAVAGLVRYIRQSGFSRNFVVNSLLVTALYFAHAIVGIVVLIWLTTECESGWGLALAAFGWFPLGLLMVFRLAPGAGETQRRIGRMFVLELVCMAMVVIGLSLCAGLI